MARIRANGPEKLRLRSCALLATVDGRPAAGRLPADGSLPAYRRGAGRGRRACRGRGHGRERGTAGFGSGGDVCPMSQRVMPTPEDVPLAIVALDRTTSMTMIGTRSPGIGQQARRDPNGASQDRQSLRECGSLWLRGIPRARRRRLSAPALRAPSAVRRPSRRCTRWDSPGRRTSSRPSRTTISAQVPSGRSPPRSTAPRRASSTQTRTDFSSHSVVLITDGVPGCSTGDACKDAASAAFALKGDIHVLDLGPPGPNADCLRMLNMGFGSYDTADPHSRP